MKKYQKKRLEPKAFEPRSEKNSDGKELER